MPKSRDEKKKGKTGQGCPCHKECGEKRKGKRYISFLFLLGKTSGGKKKKPWPFLPRMRGTEWEGVRLLEKERLFFLVPCDRGKRGKKTSDVLRGEGIEAGRGA